MYPTKRRRMGNTASTLTKPFRSPLSSANVPSKPPVASLEQGHKNADHSRQTSPHRQKDNEQSPVRVSSRNAATTSSPLPERQRLVLGVGPQTLSSTTRPIRDPGYLALQKQRSNLMLQLKHLSTSVDTSGQALKILDSNADADLELLVHKWRTAARDVAEELFGIAKDRVNKMGGVSAWRERYRPQNDEDESPWRGGSDIDEDELNDEQREQLEIARDEARREAERYGMLERPQQTAVQREDDSFTIDMMLRQLNVDLEVIGYDIQAQRWTD